MPDEHRPHSTQVRSAFRQALDTSLLLFDARLNLYTLHEESLRSLEEQYDKAQHVNELLNSASETLKQRNAELVEQVEAALVALDKGRRFERAYQESLGATPTATQYEIIDNLQSAFIDAYVPLLSNPATEASEGGSSAGNDGSVPGTPGLDGSAERLSRPAAPPSEASDPATKSEGE